MVKVEKERFKRLSKKDVKTHVINIEELEKMNVDKQAKYFEDIFKKTYSNVEVESLRKYALRCIKLTCDPKDNSIHLPYGVKAQKKDNKIYIKVYKNKHIFLIMLFLTLLLLSILGASYSTINYSIIKNLNKDIDGDGIPELNLDLNSDREAEVNIDTTGDNKPNLNIDYKGNRKAIFNIDRNKNGQPDYNLMNRDLNNDGKCDLNCDTNKDGWPDINLDTNGNRKPDLNIDTDGDGIADLNFDMNVDMKCDLHCDINNDKVCDKYCLTKPDLEEFNPGEDLGSSSNNSYKDMLIQSGELILEYDESGKEVRISDLIPEDQANNPATPNAKPIMPIKEFKITNKSLSSLSVRYNIKLVVDNNTFTTDNFQYQVVRDGVALTEFKPVPKSDGLIYENAIIAVGNIHNYTINFKLAGAKNNDEDKNKIFKGHIEIYIDN